MNQLALAYGIAGLSVAIAIAAVIGTGAEPVAADGPAFTADPVTGTVADRRRERPRRSGVARDPSPVAPPQDVQYVDEQGNPVAPPSAGGPSRHEEEEEDDDDHEEHERREHGHDDEDGDDD